MWLLSGHKDVAINPKDVAINPKDVAINPKDVAINQLSKMWLFSLHNHLSAYSSQAIRG